MAQHGNSNLHSSRNDKADEFYTQISFIENELKHYKDYFKDKVKLFIRTIERKCAAFHGDYYIMSMEIRLLMLLH